MTHPIDAAKAQVKAALAKHTRSNPHTLSWDDLNNLDVLVEPDPRVTALVEAVKGSLGSVGYIGTSNELRAALAPFLKDESDAN